MVNSTCGYLIHNGRYLMLYRNRKKNDVNAGKWIGVGGKTEPGETPLECMVREIREETGLIADRTVYRGTLYFHYKDAEEETIRIYTIPEFHGTMIDCNEGTLAWIEKSEVLNLPLWEGDKLFLRRLLAEDGTIFCLDLFYDTDGSLIEAKEIEAEEE